MTSVRLEVQWSPVHPDKFVTWGTEIYLYETLPKRDAVISSCIDLSDTISAHLVATNSNHHYLKCVDIYPKEEPDILLAVGQANGKVVLTTFGQTVFDTQGLAGMELIPKHPRQCNVVMWNKVDYNLIALGLDRYRTDHCVMVWDTQLGRGANTVAEMGLSDAAHSLAWLYTQPRSLIVGMNNKHLKMVDLRDPSKAINSSPTKAVHGLTVSPHNDHLVASFVDAQIAIWDTRNFDKPVLTLPQTKPIMKLLWCPTRHNLLGSLQRDSRSIHLHDVQQTVEDNDPSVLERSVKPGISSFITSFTWHPKHENRLLILSLQGALTDFCVSERMTLNWSQTSNIVWTQGRKVIKGINDTHAYFNNFQDLTKEIKRRALLNYGLKHELKSNGDLVEDEDLKELWRWLHHSKTLVNEGLVEAIGSCQHPGVRSVLGLDATNSSVSVRSETVYSPWIALNSTSNATVKVYRSDTRDKALYLCGWRFVHDANAFQQLIDQLDSEGNTTRAAAIAVFSLRLRQGIKVLAADPKYNTVAMALSGFTDDKNSIWRESCLASKSQITDPYLRAIFAFLTADNDNYDSLLYESGMSIRDRVGFALTFLSDIRLAEFINHLTDFLSGSGHLSGFLLTGVSQEAIPLFQRYLDEMGDIQSVSLIVMRSFPPDLLENEKVLYWINWYRELLDSWRLWSQRAQFDIWLNRRAGTRPEPQMFIWCNFCGKNMSTQSLQRSKSPYPRLSGTSNQTKVSCCPNCRKPQPRCSICLVNMGTASCFIPDSLPSPTGEKVEVNPFDYWFTWCQTCRHGGHAAHMTQWFKDHSECPVTACSCRCPSLDASSNVPSITSQS